MEYYTLRSNNNKNISYNEISNGFLQEKKSKFISYIFTIQNDNMAKDCINRIKNDNKEARHIVYIYSYVENNNVNIKFSDDGEPQGTGTRAIYDMLQKENITNICIVIVRYFGGILLGAGPLSRAYLNSFKEAYLKCSKIIIYNYIDYNIKTDYSNLNNIKYIISMYKNKEAIIDFIEYNDEITINFKVIDKFFKDFKEKIKQYIK